MTQLKLSSLAPRAGGPRSNHASGFTLIEVLIAMVISILLIVGIYNLFELNARISRVQSDVAEMQQAQRIAQHDLARIMQMAGRGGVPLGTLPAGMAFEVLDNAADDAHISPADDSTPDVLVGTDVLTVRGAFSAPVYQAPTEDGQVITFDAAPPSAATAGTFTVTTPTNTAIPQDLQPLIDAVTEGRPEALLVTTTLGDQIFFVVELDPENSDVSDEDNLTIAFLITGGTHTDAYSNFTPGGAIPEGNDTFSYTSVALLEEYRYYVRELTAGGELVPILSRARVYPGTQSPWADEATNWSVDMVDNVLDLQLALGIDADGDGAVADGNAAEDGDPAEDEWLYNAVDDDDADPKWAAGTFLYLRATSLVRSERNDRGYLAPELTLVENHDYDDSPLNDEPANWFRRRTLTTTVDLRNAG